jgi:peptidase MA superfamily protein
LHRRPPAEVFSGSSHRWLVRLRRLPNFFFALSCDYLARRLRGGCVVLLLTVLSLSSLARAATPLQAPEPGIAARGPTLPRDALPKDALDPGVGVPLPAPPEGFNTYDGGWMRLAFPPSRRHRVQPLIHEADAFRDRLRDLFGYPVLNRVSVYVARTPGEMATLAPPGSPFPKYAEGVAYPGLGLILLTIDPKQPNAEHDLAEVFRHELAHLALHEALEGQHVPLWLNEGFAIHLSGESSLARMQTLWTATLAETLMPLAQLDGQFPDDEVQTPIAYAQSADIVRHLLRTRYSQRFIAMLRRVRGGQPFASAMSDAYGFEVYGVGANSLEDEWRRDVAKRYSFWPVLFSGSMVWVGALGLFVVGYFRRKKQQRVTLDRWALEEAAAERQSALGQAQASRMHIVIAPKEVPPEPLLPEFKKPSREVDVPKVEHDGSWHTLH